MMPVVMMKQVMKGRVVVGRKTMVIFFQNVVNEESLSENKVVIFIYF